MHALLIGKVLTSAQFISCLALLMLNDCVLKHAYPGWVTGKLSDFAGVGVVSLLLVGLFPERKWAASAAVAVMFAWWKSPASQAFILLANEHLKSTLGRVVDPTDLLALVMMPWTVTVVMRLKRSHVRFGELRRKALMPIVLLTALALMGTSVINPRKEYQIRRSMGEAFDLEQVSKVIRGVAERHGLECNESALATLETFCSVGTLSLKYRLQTSSAIEFEIRGRGALIFGSDMGKADWLRADVRAALSAQVAGLEYVEVEPLPRGARE